MSETRPPYNLRPEELLQQDEDVQQEAFIEYLKAMRHIGKQQVAAVEKFLRVYGVEFKSIDKK
jgi:hypothetical protein